MDLDLVVVGPLDDFFSYGDADEVILARNPNTPLERLGQTSLFRFPVGKLLPLQEKFLADPQGVADTYQFEQRFVTREAPGGVEFWPDPWVRHFRMHCARTLPLNFFLPPRLPRDARVVIFPGGLLPPHAIAGQWGGRYRPQTPAAAPARPLRPRPPRPAAALPAPLPPPDPLGRRGLARGVTGCPAAPVRFGVPSSRVLGRIPINRAGRDGYAPWAAAGPKRRGSSGASPGPSPGAHGGGRGGQRLPDARNRDAPARLARNAPAPGGQARPDLSTDKSGRPLASGARHWYAPN